MSTRPRSRVLVVAVTLLLALLTACSGGGAPDAAAPPPPVPRRLPEPLPGPAEPAVAPPAATTPAGRVVPVGPAPEGVVADGPSRTAAVGVRAPDELALVNVDSGAVTGRVPLPGVVRHLQLAGPGGPVLVPDESANAFLRVALPGGRIESRVTTGASPHDATQASPDTVFVADEGGGSLTVVRGDQVVRTFTDVTQPGGLAAAAGRVGAIDVRENTLSVYDPATLTPLAELPAGAGPTHLIADRNGRLLVADTRGNRLLVFDPAGTPRQLADLPLPGSPYGLGYDATRDRLWVTLTATNEVVGFDTSGPQPREVARFPTVRQPNTVAADPATGRVVVTGTAEGVLQLIDP
ncbi:Vgb family protein [Actinomycetospora lemnae]|uniref:YncE family protein n=1 Tax=Actinomycetospora lemnae TaxID=3019891 RepID=A0ABT5SMJ3_9PSEU|nr:YncE family protein [Actinomycetospora sp. DW7H6]MDD7964065.1 YncE family protein [Actinomycetospora sp. DW7H6]